MHGPKPIKLNSREKRFLASHEIDPSSVMDFRGSNKAEAHEIAKSLGMEVIYWIPCNNCGSNLRTRNSACIECNRSALTRQRRHSAPGYCYLAYSPSTGLCKVGSSKTMKRRLPNLRTHRYAGASDWEELGRGWVQKSGQIENEIRSKMGGLSADIEYNNDGAWHKSIEAVKIDPKTAWWHFIRILNRNGASEIYKSKQLSLK